MDFQPSERCLQFKERLTAFMDEHIYPAEKVYELQLRESGKAGGSSIQPPIMEELKSRAREAGLWNMFLPDPEHGAPHGADFSRIPGVHVKPKLLPGPDEPVAFLVG